MPPVKDAACSTTYSGLRRRQEVTARRVISGFGAARLVADQLRLALAAGKQAILRLFQSEDFTYASCIAYYSLISLFPFLMLAVSLLGRLTDSEARRAEVGSFVMQTLSGAGGPRVGRARSHCRCGIRRGPDWHGRHWVGGAGVFRVISHAVNHAWDLEDKPGVLRISSSRSP